MGIALPRYSDDMLVNGYGRLVVSDAYNGCLGQSPQRGPGAELLVSGSGGRSPLPPEADSILAFER